MPTPKKIAISFETKEDEMANFHFHSGQVYERAAIIQYIRGLKSHQAKLFRQTVALGASPQLMRELLTTIEKTLLKGEHHK